MAPAASVTLTAARAALRCPTCGFHLTGMPWHEAVRVDRCVACGFEDLRVEAAGEDAPRRVRWGEFPI